MAHRTIISVNELAEHLADPSWVVLDCRFNLVDSSIGEKAYAEEHIPSALYAHLDRDLSSEITPTSGRHPLPDPEVLATKLGEWGVGSSSQVVVYDDASGGMAARAWWLLRWLGHENVALLDGGWQKWLASGFMTSQDSRTPEPQAFVANVHEACCVTAEELTQRLADESVLLVDARAEERFFGEVEPIDPVAGHIPGAVNRPFNSNLDHDGCFLAPEMLSAQFDRLLGHYASEQVVHMCGSGVTACHNLLAMEIAGFHGSKLYAGSWSEWIRDPARKTA